VSGSPRTNQHLNSLGSSGGRSVGIKPVQATSVTSGSAAGSFYKPASKPGQVSAVQPPSSANTSAAPKKAAISVRGKCVPHAENRFKVEVGYHAELIAVFKSIPSKNYVDQAAAISSVSLRPVEGIGALDSAAAPSRPCDRAVLAALLKLCNGWQKPGATLRGQCILVSRTKFEVDILYHADVIATFKQMPTKNYGTIAFSLISVFPNDLGSKCFLIAQFIADMTTRKWSFSLEDYKRLMDLLSGIAGVEVEPLPRPVIQAFAARFDGSEAKSLDVPEADLSSIDPTLTSSLMPFQKEGVNFAVSKQGRLLLADDMGLGKTVQAICIAAYYRNEWPLLVVAPSSVRFTWAEAFRRWLPSLSPGSINVVVKAKDDMRSGLVNIVSYDLLSRMDKQHPGHSFYVLIMAAKRVILLSGTPAMSRPCELYTQILAVRPALFPRFHEFGVRYCDARELLLEECLMLRRLKADVLSQLPSKQRKVVTVTIEGVSTRTKAALSAAAKQLAKDHRSKMEEKEALLIFYNHTAEAKLQAIIAFNFQQSVSFIRIDGATPSAERQQLCETFQYSSKSCVAVLSITAANMGLTLHSADLVIFAELFWNPGVSPHGQMFVRSDRISV
ncbi:hypothetical protein GOODEAATRI_003713, partial [Goodea atripinnis]